MNDIEYMLKCDAREKKSAGRGIYAKRNGSKSRYVSLPSDKLTPAQLKRRNGPVKSYNINTRITNYETFKALPLDLKKLYLHSLIRAYNASGVKIAQSMNVSPNTLYAHLKLVGIDLGISCGGRKAKPEWEKFLAGTYTTTGVPVASCPPDVEIIAPEEPAVEEVVEPIVEETTEVAQEEKTVEPVDEKLPDKVVPEVSGLIINKQSFLIEEATPEEFIDYIRKTTIPGAKYSFSGCVMYKED